MKKYSFRNWLSLVNSTSARWKEKGIDFMGKTFQIVLK